MTPVAPNQLKKQDPQTAKRDDLLRAIDAACRKQIPPGSLGNYTQPKFVSVPEAAYGELRKRMGKEFGTPAQRNELGELEKQHRDGTRAIAGLGPITAKRKYLAHQVMMADRTAAEILQREDGWSLDDFVEEDAEQMRAIKARCLSLVRQAVVIGKPIIEQFIGDAHRFAIDREVEDRLTHEQFGISGYEPSLLIRTLRSVKPDLEARLATWSNTTNWSARPAELLQHIVEL